MRTSKTVNGTVTEYIYDGSTLLAQKVGNDWMYFFYDADGILGFLYNNCAYYYAKNLQGDVLSVLDSYGLTVCEYTYDSWGKLITVTDDSGNAVTDSTHVALLNPIRYRGYLYDSETGFYYLQSRYYNPEVKRFVNGDGYASTGQGMLGNNMFAYCGNNPIIRADTSGQWWELVLGLVVCITALIMTSCSTRESTSTPASSSSTPSSSSTSSSSTSSSSTSSSSTSSKGSPRHIYYSQNPKSKYFDESQWSPASTDEASSDGCATACVAMSLSYWNESITPGTVYRNNGNSIWVNWDKQGYKTIKTIAGETPTSSEALRKKIDNYLSNPDKYSAPIASKYGHYYVFIGYAENGDYLVLNPGNKNIVETLPSTQKIYTQVQYVR